MTITVLEYDKLYQTMLTRMLEIITTVHPKYLGHTIRVEGYMMVVSIAEQFKIFVDGTHMHILAEKNSESLPHIATIIFVAEHCWISMSVNQTTGDEKKPLV